jgi:hypothetical protein
MERQHPCNAALLAYEQAQPYCIPTTMTHLYKVMASLYTTLHHRRDFPVYTKTHLASFWYKSCLLTPAGGLWFDIQEHYIPVARAHRLIKTPCLRLSATTPEAFFTNWLIHGIEARRILGHALCTQWMHPIPPPAQMPRWRTLHLLNASQVSKRQRFRILKRDGYRCTLCGHAAAEGARLEVDHRIARAEGGTNDDANLHTLCFSCNRGKSTYTL